MQRRQSEQLDADSKCRSDRHAFRHAAGQDAGHLQPADASGHLLPIDPVRVPLDLPLAAQSDSALLAVLDALRQSAPELYGRIVQAERIGKEELRFLSILRDGLGLDKLTTAAIERSAIARYQSL